MADQSRWFKLWVTAPMDDALQGLSPALRWAWAVLGCYTKVHGTNGRVEVSTTNSALASQMCVPLESLQDVIKAFPNLHVEEGPNSNGTIAVTWKNWVKYQVDTTVAERQRTSRSKRRREENKKRRDDIDPIGSMSGVRVSARRCLEFLNEKTGRTFQAVPANLKLLEARLKEGATEANIRGVIARKVREWQGDPKMAEYLRPKTLFNATNFAQYLGQREAAGADLPSV